MFNLLDAYEKDLSKERFDTSLIYIFIFYFYSILIILVIHLFIIIIVFINLFFNGFFLI